MAVFGAGYAFTEGTRAVLSEYVRRASRPELLGVGGLVGLMWDFTTLGWQSVFIAQTVGNDLRKEYTALGDFVNLAARLMAKAGPREIYVDA